MAKKRFTDDLSGFFENDPFGTDTGLEQEENAREEAVEVSVPVKNKKAAKKLSNKNFTQNLDSFLTEDSQRGKAAAPTVSRRRRKRSGLDLLIRSTVSDEDREAGNQPQKPDTKRVTLVFNKEHLLILKEQAKDRKMYLKDVVQEMVAQYLEE